jgi:hypothetical protein
MNHHLVVVVVVVVAAARESEREGSTKRHFDPFYDIWCRLYRTLRQYYDLWLAFLLLSLLFTCCFVDIEYTLVSFSAPKN